MDRETPKTPAGHTAPLVTKHFRARGEAVDAVQAALVLGLDAWAAKTPGKTGGWDVSLYSGAGTSIAD